MTEYISNTPLTITGKNFEDCKQQLMEKYGANFTILEKGQKLESKFFGFIRKEYYEVTYLPKPRVVETKPTKKVDDDFEKQKAAILKTATEINSSKQVPVDSLNSKLEDITKRLENISNQQNNKHETIQKIEKLLSDNEFTFSYINGISERIKNEFSLNQLDDFKTVERNVIDWIGESIQITQPKTFRPPHVILFVGPTGVGKTTTIAKFAAKQILDAKQENDVVPKLCIMTTDIMRVGAVEQLQHFGAIMNTDVKKAESAKDVQKIYEDNKDIVDTIYIDTAGYSPNDSANIGKMKAMFEVPGLNPDVYLVMSASTKASDMETIMQNYEQFGFRSVIVTKCDETKKYGNVISTISERHKSISYICDGQNAARNLGKANVVDFLIRLDGFNVDRIHIEDKFGEK